jgi:predicted TIM-barrel fold metal-dependent hydrolase
LPPRVDLMRECVTEHYLPVEREVDLELYINKNLTPQDLANLKHDLVWKGFGKSGMRATHTLPNIARQARDLKIETSVLLPIDFPVISSNARTYLRLVAGRKDFISFGSVHPYDLSPERALDKQHAMGARGIKVHPAVQLVPPDAPRSLRLFEAAGERGMVVLLHCGPVGIEALKKSAEYTQVERYEPAIKRMPNTTFVLGHSGGLQFDEALALSLRYPNVYLEIASQSLRAIQRMVDEGPVERVLFGTDWPFYHQGLQLAKVLIATEGNMEARRAILSENAKRLLGRIGARSAVVA